MMNNVILYDNYDFFKNMEIRGLPKWDILSDKFRNLLKERYLQYKKQMNNVYNLLKTNKREAVSYLKSAIITKARLELLAKSLLVPASRNELFHMYKKWFNIDIDKDYKNLNENNVKSMVLKYGKITEQNLNRLKIL